MTRSEEIAARTFELSLQRRLAFAGAVCMRARHVFAICHGATSLEVFDRALDRLWDDLQCGDMADIDAIYPSLERAPESFAADTLSRDWLAWLTLSTFEFVSLLPTSKLPVQSIAQSSSLGLTIAAELDLRLGWMGPAKYGELAAAEWDAQRQVLDILKEDPLNAEVPIERLSAAGDRFASLLASRRDALAASTGWDLAR